MLKGKLLAIISGSMSVVVAATTALTLGISGPRNTMSLNALSENDAVAYGISGIFNSATSGVDTVTQVIDTISENKAALSMGFDINKIEDLEELSGLGANLDINFDIENNQYSIDANAVYGTVELFNAILYMDEKELAASMPTFYNGVITVAYDNLAEDMENSYVGSMLKEEGFDFDEFKKELETILEQAATSYTFETPDIDFEEINEALTDAIEKAYDTAINNMDVQDNGKQPLNGGKYQSYTASISVADLSYIIKDALISLLKSEAFGEYVDYIMETLEETAKQSIEEYNDYDDDYDYDYDEYDDIFGGMSDMNISYSETLKSYAPMIETYWPAVVSSLEKTLGKNIEFTIYLTDTVETAGFEFYASPNADGSLNYSKAATKGAEAAVIIKADFTGGKEIGDYSYISLECLEFGESVMLGEYTLKMEEKGNFTIDITIAEEDKESGSIKIDGKYTENDMFFTLNIDSLKFIENGETLFDIGFHFSFEPINSVIRPSGSPEYDIWEMNEQELEALFDEINDNVEKIESILEKAFN